MVIIPVLPSNHRYDKDLPDLGGEETPSKPSPSALKHLSYLCPGLHGPDTRQRVARTTFGRFLAGPTRVLIPLFQRRYCWDWKRVTDWWSDTVAGKRDHLGVHNSGNIVVKKLDHEFVCIDGQQRLTTTMILWPWT